MAKLKIWGRASSLNVQKVLWVADEIGLEYERIDAGGSFGRTDDPAYRAMNPNGRVPTIEDGGFVLWESNTICRYLATRERAHALLPDCASLGSMQARAAIEKWMDWGSTMLGPALTPGFLGLVRTPAAQRDLAAIARSGESTAAQLAILEGVLATQPYVAGQQPTLAEMPAAILASRWLRLPWTEAGYRPVALPNVQRWHDRLAQRPAFARWVLQPMS